MVDSVYIEQAIMDLPRTATILARYPKARQIIIERYGEVFNSHAQNFRIQKQNPSLILAAKQNSKVMPTPAQYETGGGAHYYFSHMLNCVYDCRYCFLQGMLRSANYLLFVNYDDFLEEIKQVAKRHVDDAKPVWFFSGYDCDSLAYEPVTKFAEVFVPAFKEIPNAVLELRTKSTQIRSLLNMPAQENVVVAYSLSPDAVAQQVEFGAPPFAKRLEALQRLQAHGWRIGIRFDPIVWHSDYVEDYRRTAQAVFETLDPKRIDSVTLGGFRLPKGFHKTMSKLYPEHWILNAGLDDTNGMVAYRQEIEAEVLETVSALCQKYMPADKLFCYSSYESE
ncbi:SPL family radical SAM protein [Arenicella xantha]|uniref:Spore photoproduct lyase n=1 Tax=Arenicella xantha TaxID=644221 RepID=A0A395JEU8_9GAMM|nr:radical SAM protein [Arenicella xantha]RBP48278.1 spore photoproduct lyase [Arenicella xantha]